nr:BA14K family protein [uncultured Gellertiella sp.]
MRILGQFAFGFTLALSTVLPDFAAALPRFEPAQGTGNGLVQKTGGIVCDLSGCRTYETRRRIYIDPPDDDDQGFYADPPPEYIFHPPRRRRPIYVDPPVYRRPRPVLSRQHVEWCLDRYQSYNPRTNLYLARRNVFRQCVSPWD